MHNWCSKPRAELASILVELEELNPWHLDRLTLRPGKAVALIVRLRGVDWIDLLERQPNL